MDRLPEELNNQLFRKLKSIVEIERMSADQRLEYELSLAVERDMLSALDAKYEDGREEGLKEGRMEGHEEGLKEGLLKVACTLKQSGMPLPEIAKATGLTSEEIEAL